MPLTVDNSPALLNEEFSMATQKNQRVKATRAFYHKGEVVGVGSILDFPLPIAAELRSANKVEFVQSDTKLKSTTEVPAPAKANPKEDEETDEKASGKKGAAKGGAK